MSLVRPYRDGRAVFVCPYRDGIVRPSCVRIGTNLGTDDVYTYVYVRPYPSVCGWAGKGGS